MPFRANMVGLAMLVFGLVMTTAAARSFNRAGTNIKTFDEPDVLVTDGWFRYTRNPMYLGFATALLGLAGVLGSTSPLFAVAAFGIVTDRWYIQFEERAMQRQFGPAYDAYRARTRRWI